jgi:3-hydroxyisobutyrate dehydrogenase-like beta-hydroxyacid dehydrogenase
VELEKLLPLLSRSWGQSRMLERNGPRILARDFGPSASPLRHLEKDLGIAMRLAGRASIGAAAAETARRAVSAQVARGRGDWDISALALGLEES